MTDGNPPATGLPPGEGVNVEYLANSLDDTTNSYKFLLLKVILQRMEDYDGKGHLPIDIDYICRQKLVYSWFPSRQFRLNFGKQDMVATVLSDVIDNEEIISGDAYTNIEQVNDAFEAQKDAIARVKSVRDLVRDSIRRLIKPAFEEEIGELERAGETRDNAKTSPIPTWSRERFDSGKPPIYRTDNKTEIVIHELWCKYLFTNLTIIKGWLDNRWMQNLARINPHVPGLAHKLWALPDDRDSLKSQREFWGAYLKKHHLNCIYREKRLVDPSSYALDHFLPRSWLGHDQIWNLIPTDPLLNSCKKNFLPAEDYIEKLASAHFHLLEFAFSNNVSNRSNMVDDYCFGLHITEATLKDENLLYKAYAGTIDPLLRLARRQGFKNWQKRN